MFEHIVVVGAGRAGRPIAQRLGERYDVSTSGRELDCEGADLVVVCTPDSAIEQVAQALDVGPWICHVSGATRLDALAPHERRFSVHPLRPGAQPGGSPATWSLRRSRSPTMTGRSTTRAPRSPQASWSRSSARPPNSLSARARPARRSCH